MTDPIVSVPVGDLLRVAPFKANDDVRYYLNGILVTPYEDHALLVATNGHWLGIYESAEARTDKDRILDVSEGFLRQLSADDPEDLDDEEEVPPARMVISRTLTIADESARIVVSEKSGTEVLVKAGAPFIDGKFPDWKKVLPDSAKLEEGIFAPVAPYYLASLHEAVPDEREHPLFCFHTRAEPAKPIVFRFGNLAELVVVLMPRRDSDKKPQGWPAWMVPAK